MSTAQQPAGAASSPAIERLIRELYERTQAREFAFSLEQFQSLVLGIAAKQRANAPEVEVLEFVGKLKVEELVLARACAAGNDKAWEIFLTRFRARIYEIALAITRSDSSGRELADSVYAELYGVSAHGQQRTSKLLYYSGRGSLEGWLRTVLAQEFVDRYRETKPNLSLEAEQEHGFEPVAASGEEARVPDPRLTPAIDQAIAQIEPEERFLLAAYFLDGQTLAQIARSLKVHESTISRKLERITSALRKSITNALTQTGMSKAQAEEALDVDVRDLAIDVRASLQESGTTAFLSEKEEG